MKRLAMAATFALALSIGGWGQAAAQADDSTAPQAGDVQAAGEAGNDETDSSDSESPSPSDPADDEDASDPGQGEDSTDPGGDENASDPGDGEESTDPDENTDEPTDDSTPIDASFSLDKTEMTVDEAAKAIPYTVTGLKAGDTVTASPGEGGAHTVDSDGTFKGELRGNTELKEGGTLDVTVTVAREGQESKTFTGSVKITANDDEAAALSVSPKSSGIDDFLYNGVGMTMSNCEPGQDVKFEIHSTDDPDQFYWEDTQKADEEGTSFMTFLPGTGGDAWIGDFVATATCGDQSADAPFSVTEDGEGADADLSVTPKSQALSDFLKNGVNITLVNCHVDSEVTFRVSTKRDPDTEVWKETQKAGEDAAGSVRFTPEEGGVGWADEFLVMASCGDKSAETTFTVTDDGSVVDPKLSVDPEKLPGEDFIDRDKGVNLTVTECEPGADVNFQVWGHDSSEKLYDQTAEADDNGAAAVQVYGLDSDPGAYVGTYQVTAMCMEQAMNGKFVVTGDGSGGSGGGSDESGKAGDAGSMPRTGAELTGLTAGALLILGGAAAIAVARRKNRS
ncbi:LPXTG cell wall anchor domain-containing protein [Brevibacterium oceani]|uniref:LPXTG cell wall anchor domain-containing protein n=1 Tax=Brevibacterium oceani TaxID=358099 RepID=UPI001B318983|nr:LPXTG cell wall anchor domain-containing protein [Brevibacterium oceani]